MVLLGWLLSVSFRAWYIFVESYLISRVVIWILADVLKVRLKRPLLEATRRRNTPPLVEKPDSGQHAGSPPNYSTMDYKHLRGILKDSTQIDSLSNDGFRSFALAYAYKVQKRIIHIHHFILGIPLMPLTWVLYFYDIRWSFYPSISLGMVLAGSTFALFMSEFWHLLTQDWGP